MMGERVGESEEEEVIVEEEVQKGNEGDEES